MNTQKIYDYVNGVILDILENAKAGNWEREWISAGKEGNAYNPASGHIYSGINQILLSYKQEQKKYSLNRWLSFKQITERKGTVKPGERSTMVVFNAVVYIDNNKKKLTGEEATEYIKKGLKLNKYYLLRYYNVFNVAQTEGLPERFYKETEQKNKYFNFSQDETAESILINSKAVINCKLQDRAFYSTANDSRTLPEKNSFLQQWVFMGLLFMNSDTGQDTRRD